MLVLRRTTMVGQQHSRLPLHNAGLNVLPGWINGRQRRGFRRFAVLDVDLVVRRMRRYTVCRDTTFCLPAAPYILYSLTYLYRQYRRKDDKPRASACARLRTRHNIRRCWR